MKFFEIIKIPRLRKTFLIIAGLVVIAFLFFGQYFKTNSGCITSSNISTVKILKIDPPVGTILEVGQTYHFTVRIQYQLKTRAKAFLELAVYNFKNEDGVGRSAEAQVEVNKGCGIYDMEITHVVKDDYPKTQVKLAVVLRVNSQTLLSNLIFLGPFPIQQQWSS